MNKILILLIAAFGCSCSTLPEQYSASPTRCLVQGVFTVEPVKKDTFSHAMLGVLDPNDHTPLTTQKPTWTSHVQINSVDGGEILWVRGYHLGDKVWLEPGVHKLLVMCTTEYSWGSIMVGTQVEVDIQPGYKYFLTLRNPIKSTSDKPQVDVSKEESK